MTSDTAVPPAETGTGSGASSGATPLPATLLNAVRMMYLGALVSLAGLVSSLFDFGDVRGAIRSDNPDLNDGEVNAWAAGVIGTAVLVGLVGPALWFWMARQNKKGKRWARVLATVFFAIHTIAVGPNIIAPGFTLLTKGTGVITWALGLVAVILMWRAESSRYYLSRVKG